MLIAMMANTYQQVIRRSEKEWTRQVRVRACVSARLKALSHGLAVDPTVGPTVVKVTTRSNYPFNCWIDSWNYVCMVWQLVQRLDYPVNGWISCQTSYSRFFTVVFAFAMSLEQKLAQLSSTFFNSVNNKSRQTWKEFDTLFNYALIFSFEPYCVPWKGHNYNFTRYCAICNILSPAD